MYLDTAGQVGNNVELDQLLHSVASDLVYRIYPKYWDTLSTYHTCPKI